jgi:hypothetical protein
MSRLGGMAMVMVIAGRLKLAQETCSSDASLILAFDQVSEPLPPRLFAHRFSPPQKVDFSSIFDDSISAKIQAIVTFLLHSDA